MPQTLPPSSSPPPNIYFGMFKVCTALDCVLQIHVISFRDSFHTLRVLQSTLQPPTTLTLLHQYVTNVEFDFQQLIIGHFWSQVLKLGPKDTLTTTDEQNGHCPGFGQVLCQYWCFRQRFCQQWLTGSSLCRRSTSSQNMCLPLQLQHSGISKWCMSVSAIASTGFMW